MKAIKVVKEVRHFINSPYALVLKSAWANPPFEVIYTPNKWTCPNEAGTPLFAWEWDFGHALAKAHFPHTRYWEALAILSDFNNQSIAYIPAYWTYPSVIQAFWKR
jgi:hypothetical protein